MAGSPEAYGTVRLAASRCHVLQNAGARNKHGASDEIRLFARCRNERLRLPAFLSHYRRLGVNRFFLVDNGSTDGSVDFLDEQTDVHVFRVTSRYSEAGMGIDWMNALLARFGAGRWCVTVDIDELLMFPASEHVSLRTLTAYFDRRGFNALACMLLDMYPPRRLDESGYVAGEDLIAACPFFDTAPYERIRVDNCPDELIRGGVRERVFFSEFRNRGVAARLYDALLYKLIFRIPVLGDLRGVRALARPTPPCLTKVPLVRWDESSQYLQSTHWISSKTVASDTGVLLHFKFLQDFHRRAVQEAARGEHWNNASEYRRYAALLEQQPDLTLISQASTRFESTAQLVELGLMQETDDWKRYRETGTT